VDLRGTGCGCLNAVCLVIELTYIDRDWYRLGALDFVTAATYMLVALIVMTSIEELILLVSGFQVSK